MYVRARVDPKLFERCAASEPFLLPPKLLVCLRCSCFCISSCSPEEVSWRAFSCDMSEVWAQVFVVGEWGGTAWWRLGLVGNLM